MVKAKAVNSFRTASCMCALNDTRFARPLHEAATVQITVTVRDKRAVKDPDNWLAACKAAIDGLVDAGVFLNDKHLNHKPVLTLTGTDTGIKFEIWQE